ncbi:MAG: hypothetical protein A2X34_00405 [Elusimicrobia bacterium GWC2_51_8]|nr:MAG: hypothetical protein A2X33_04635 [Elusimicrobia bacterium GWA2_51_34]OGR62897.1 MAG: hypothetical protein A2X34_00405 [Elusimicrobia bacterium GWC2_51_8]OGR85442.1 MAG: hypothetical protein A2021_06150 [Elusimicrobia bacterium GWF2_52_66]HAF94943.1 hypothetical protein [Elusimicrobiota bacterium]HCE97483.1 hypothetical protein [Elusimicrobiota bacterium]
MSAYWSLFFCGQVSSPGVHWQAPHFGPLGKSAGQARVSATDNAIGPWQARVSATDNAIGPWQARVSRVKKKYIKKEL